jgi:hypothetical protein
MYLSVLEVHFSGYKLFRRSVNEVRRVLMCLFLVSNLVVHCIFKQIYLTILSQRRTISIRVTKNCLGRIIFILFEVLCCGDNIKNGALSVSSSFGET